VGVDRTELAWAAGFFDAEGWAAAVKSRRGKRPIAQINQADANGVPEVLTRFRAAVGVGRVRGPKRESGKVDLYHWVASSRGDVRRTFEAIAPWLGGVKMAQFVDAIGPLPAPERSRSAEEELAWGAGLFDGDGSTCFERHGTRAGYQRADMSVTQTSRTGTPEVLVRFHALAGVGYLNGPYGGNERWEPVYRWKAHRLIDVERVARLISPWLGTVKRMQALNVITVVSAQAALPRGNPAWGSHKTHCIRGHEYASIRIHIVPGRSAQVHVDHRSSALPACANTPVISGLRGRPAGPTDREPSRGPWNGSCLYLLK
jgi:hypothetical protein